MIEYRIVVMGPGGVGKSATTVQFIQNVFVTDYDPTIEDPYRKQVSVDDKGALLEILDTAGPEEYSAMREAYIRNGDGFILMYSITERQSFEEMPELFETIYRVRDTENVPIVLVGNKVDLEEDRQVTTEEGKELAQKNECLFFEASAKTRVNVDEQFYELVREIRRLKALHPVKQRRCIVM
mmetsp:Transcript_26251/g.29225  ORF Transcript_26251/g.29225 Transcript_26251/m.29225 type:complete len:182 (+) Transcript_26251:48-593(+)